MNLSRCLSVLSVSVVLCYSLLSDRAHSLPQESVQTRIAQGFNVPSFPSSNTPWMARLERYDGQGFCGGVVLDERHVLTAAHCIAHFIAGEVNVTLASGGEQYNARATWVPYNYGWSDQANDIAVVTLGTTIPDVEPIEIADQNDLAQVPPGLLLRVLGYGQTFNGGPASQELLGGDVPYVPVNECASRWEADFPTLSTLIQEQFVCAGGNGHPVDTCVGDSGGPLLIPGGFDPSSTGYKLLGITSYGESQCGGASRPSVYTRVSQFSRGIEKARAGEATGASWTQALVSDEPFEFQAVVVTNHSDAPWVLNDFIERQSPDIFFIRDTSCTDLVLPPGQSCTLIVEFRPTVGGFYSERIQLAREDDDPVWIDLQGFAFETIDRSIFGGQPVTAFAGGEFGPKVVTQSEDGGNGYVLFEDFEPLQTVEMFVGVEELSDITLLVDVLPDGDQLMPEIEVRLLNSYGEDLSYAFDAGLGWEELAVTFDSEDFLYIRMQARGKGFDGELRIDIKDDGTNDDQEIVDLSQNLTAVDIPSVVNDVPDVAVDSPNDVALETGGSLGIWLVFLGFGCLSARGVAYLVIGRKGAGA